MLLPSQAIRRTFFLVVAIACALSFSHHALAASPAYVAPQAILSTENGKTVDVTNSILHDGSGVPLPKDETMALYIATTAPVSSLHFSGIDTYGSGGVLDYAYQDGNGFQTLTVTNDSGAHFTRTRRDGTAEVTFALPNNWSPTVLAEDVMHRSAYWIRVTLHTPYSVTPVVGQVQTILFTTQLTLVRESLGGYDGPSRAVPTAGCGSDAAVTREVSLGNGVHWFVIHTTNPTCTLTLTPPGFLTTTVALSHTQGQVQRVSDPLIITHRTKVTILDEQGLPVHDATVTFDGVAPDAERGGVYYFGNEHTTDAVLNVRRPGYVASAGTGPNEALAHVSGGTAYQQTAVTLSPFNAPCTAPSITPGTATLCGMLTPNVTVTTYATRVATSSARVTIFSDAGRTQIADDLHRVGSGDATEYTDADGHITFALREGRYYYTALAYGAPTAQGSFTVFADVANNLHIDFYPTTLSTGYSPAAGLSTISFNTQTPFVADRDVALVTVRALNGQTQPIYGSTIVLTTSSTLSSTFTTTPSSATANDLGEAFFLVRTGQEATTTLTATIDGTTITGTPTLAFVAPPHTQDTRVSPSRSSMTIDASTITVTIRHADRHAIAQATVSLRSSCADLLFAPTSATTNSAGIATFHIQHAAGDICTVEAVADDIPLDTTITTATPNGSSCASGTPGTLVKLPSDHDATTQADSAVYYIGNDCKRHAFPNAHVYDSWYDSFDSVSTITAAELASISLGKNVIYKPGVRLVKFLSLNNVYAVASNGKLRWVSSEAIAQIGYGTQWNKKVDDVSDAFYGDYTFGDDLAATGDITAELQQSAGVTIDSVL